MKATVNDQSFILDRWSPIYLSGFRRGKNWVRLELIDDRGHPIANVYNDTIVLVNYDPQLQDGLAKLIQGKLDSNLAQSLVDPNYTATKPAPSCLLPHLVLSFLSLHLRQRSHQPSLLPHQNRSHLPPLNPPPRSLKKSPPIPRKSPFSTSKTRADPGYTSSLTRPCCGSTTHPCCHPNRYPDRPPPVAKSIPTIPPHHPRPKSFLPSIKPSIPP